MSKTLEYNLWVKNEQNIRFGQFFLSRTFYMYISVYNVYEWCATLRGGGGRGVSALPPSLQNEPWLHVCSLTYTLTLSLSLFLSPLPLSYTITEMQTQQDKGIAIHVASSLTVFTLTSILFFTAGYLCRHSVCQKPKKRHAAETSAAENCTCSQHGQINTHNTPKLHALKFDLSANVAYASVLVQ